MEKEQKLFDRELTGRVLATAIEGATAGALAGLKALAAAQTQAARLAQAALEQAESTARQQQKLAEDLVAAHRKHAANFQKIWFDLWDQWYEGLRAPEIKLAAEKKSA